MSRLCVIIISVHQCLGCCNFHRLKRYALWLCSFVLFFFSTHQQDLKRVSMLRWKQVYLYEFTRETTSVSYSYTSRIPEYFTENSTLVSSASSGYVTLSQELYPRNICSNFEKKKDISFTQLGI